jgi:hypothetical protein
MYLIHIKISKTFEQGYRKSLITDAIINFPPSNALVHHHTTPVIVILGAMDVSMSASGVLGNMKCYFPAVNCFYSRWAMYVSISTNIGPRRNRNK